MKSEISNLTLLKVLRSTPPERNFIVTHDGELTYGEALKLVTDWGRRLSSHFRSLYQPILTTPTPEGVLLFLACQWSGLIPVLFNLRWSAAQIKAVFDLLPGDLIISSGLSEDGVWSNYKVVPIMQIHQENEGKYYSTGHWQSRIVLFTSGSSGIPKGVLLHERNFLANAIGSNYNIPLNSGDCWGVFLPLFHAGGLSIVYRIALAGASLFAGTRFDPEEVLWIIQKKRITHISLVPTMLRDLINVKGSTELLKQLKSLLVGGAPLDSSLMRAARDVGIKVVTTYGMTETASQITTLPLTASPEKVDSVGRVLPLREVRITAPDGTDIPYEKVGEILVKGEVLCEGYLNAEFPLCDGWFKTGDLGHFDRDGFLYLAGRKDELIISGGEKIYPVEITRVARLFPGIKDCVVLGIEDDRWGMRPALFVETETGFNLKIYLQFLKKHLSSIQFPDWVVPLEAFPRISIAKVDKKRLKQNLLTMGLERFRTR